VVVPYHPASPLKAETGERIWHFQGVRHDLWDRDFPSPPTLVTVRRDGKEVDAVAQTTKQGFVYLFDRSNGQTLFPIEYRKYPPSDVPGEVTAPEQPLPTKPAPYARQPLSEDLLTDRSPAVHSWALERFRMFRNGGQFLPFTVGKDTVVFPGLDGGAEWGGSAVDPATGILYVNSNEMALTGALAENNSAESSGRGTYQNQCSACHRDNMAGSPPQFPSLIGIGNRMSPKEITATITGGKGRMPAFNSLTRERAPLSISR
jgi:quinoprotein glucose dehydrogenase